MRRLLCASSAGQIAFLAAAIDAGLIGPGRRVLLVSDEAVTPGLGADPLGAPGVDALLDRFDEFVSWHKVIAPLHPAHWRPPAAELPLLTRLLAPVLGADELVVESITEGVGRAVAALVPGAPITLAHRGLATYGPVLRHAPSDVTERVDRSLYLDVLPQLVPRLLPRTDTDAQPVPVRAYRQALAALGAPEGHDVVLLGSDFVRSGLLTPDEQSALHSAGVQTLAATGVRELTFAPHPAADPGRDDLLAAAAAQNGVRLTIIQTPVPHEAWLGRPDTLLAGWAEPALLLAERALRLDLDDLLDRPGPYERADRMALTIVDALAPGAVSRMDTDLALLVDAVSFCLDPAGQATLRDRARTWVAAHGTAPYLRKKRLAEAGAVTVTAASSPKAPRRRPRIFRGGTGSR